MRVVGALVRPADDVVHRRAARAGHGADRRAGGSQGAAELGKEYPLPDEAAHIKEISDLFTGLSERKYPPGVRPMRRDAHTKAHGCVKAEFTVPAQVPERARLGLFKEPATHQAWVRYSNAFSSIESDGKIDVRGHGDQGDGCRGREAAREREAREDAGLPADQHQRLLLAEHASSTWSSRAST